MNKALEARKVDWETSEQNPDVVSGVMKNLILEKFHQYNKNIFDDDEEMHIHFWQSIRQMSQWHLKSIGFSLVGIWIFKNIYCRKSCIKSYLCSLKSQCDQILCINGILFVYFTDNE